MSRTIDSRYDDPLELVWRTTATRLGLRIERSAEVYAAWDGAGTLHLARAADLDADDSLAQLVFHELCHALVEGPDTYARPDWGLSNRDDRHVGREHACHRLQAALADRHGLRRFLAPTTTHRPYYDGLPADPLAEDGDPAVGPARAGWERATGGPWAEALERALAATAALASVVRGFAQGGSLWSAVASAPETRAPQPGKDA